MIKKITKLKINGCYKITLSTFCDERGVFVKNYNYKEFKRNNLNNIWTESFFSISKKNVLRGMHFQNSPSEQYKTVMCLRGSILDVLLDLRVSSKTYLQFISINLTEKKSELVYMPPGIAHGFLSLTNNSISYYNVSSLYSKKHDTGINWNSFGFHWPIKKPIISDRDNKLCNLEDFKNKFL